MIPQILTALARACTYEVPANAKPSPRDDFGYCMPRIQPGLFRQARSIDFLFTRLLPVCKDPHSAQNELRWLREHVDRLPSKSCARSKHRLLQELLCRRTRGEPLQYILGSEYFGDLEIKCRSGVLIPRLVRNDFFALLYSSSDVSYVDRKLLLQSHIL